MFVEVEQEDLVVNTKYAIISTFNTAMDIYLTTTIERSEWGSPIYTNLKEHSVIENRNTYNKLLTIKDKEKGPDYFIYFAFVPQKEKIQQRMEKRALDEILKRIIGDELFVW
jgi:hypothetical protein